MIKHLPTVSFITCTLNSQKIIKECLNSIKNLDYPKNLIEVIIVDGGSTDKTLKIAKKYPFCRIIIQVTDGPEIATAIGYNSARNELLVNFPSDNVIPNSKWLKEMVQPLIENPDVFACETLRYMYTKRDKPLNRYFALFGVNDPIAFYFHKADRASYFNKGWHLPVKAIDKGNYYIASFNSNNLPTVGANGYVIRRKVSLLISKDPEKFFHMDTSLDLLKMGYNKIAFTKNSVWHKTGEELFNFLKKRKRYATSLYLNKQKVRRYHLVDFKKDQFKLIFFVLISLTIVEPLYHSIKGYIRIHDPAWFLHPVLCFLITIVYIDTWLSFKLKILFKKNEVQL